jgi:hypothetical protein
MSKQFKKIVKTLDPENAKRIAEQHLCKTNRLYHLENHFTIKNKEGQLQLLAPMKKAQKMLAAVLHYSRHVWKIPARVLVYKDRKVGISTYVEADMFTECMEKGLDGIVIAHDVPSAQYIFQILKRYYDNYNLPKPDIERANKRELKFKDHEGFLEVLTASVANASRGRTPQYIHSSEGAFWDTIEAATSLFQALGKRIGTTHIFETTPNGEDPLFKPMWENAVTNCLLEFAEDREGNFIPTIDVKNKDEWNGFIPLYISALDDEECYFPVEEEEATRILQTVDAYESDLVDKLEATPEFLAWRRHTLAHECRGDINVFKQEYSITWQEGFIMSGQSRFDAAILDMMKIEKNPNIGVLRESSDWMKKIEFVVDPKGPLKIYHKPKSGHHYVIGIDEAEGLVPEGGKKPDESVAIVVDLDDGGVIREVAVYACHDPEEYLVEPIATLARYFNNAFIIPESVGGRGEHLITELRKIYDQGRIYRRRDEQGKPARGSVFGFRTHTGNRRRLIDDLAAVLHERSLQIHDLKTQQQLKHFKKSHKGKYEAAPGQHDDYVMALAFTRLPTVVSPTTEEVADRAVRLRIQ